MPHSMPLRTSLASSLKRRSEPTLPLKVTTLSRSKRTSESRLLKQAAHGTLDLVLQLVDDRVQADIHFLLLRELLRLAFGAHVEADDDRVRCRSQQHVTFGDGTDTRA